ncbi:hypothetical protein DM860_018049 [Cuscuta australis]|uniref:Uncharacterized protein n=1 Tax=Cuscuta australis TaxID=267555 RepID=A0A328DZL3_9ASTE|nr:hypothetical protein DM860_018049 [Cuscuta australis]
MVCCSFERFFVLFVLCSFDFVRFCSSPCVGFSISTTWLDFFDFECSWYCCSTACAFLLICAMCLIFWNSFLMLFGTFVEVFNCTHGSQWLMDLVCSKMPSLTVLWVCYCLGSCWLAFGKAPRTRGCYGFMFGFFQILATATSK